MQLQLQVPTQPQPWPHAPCRAPTALALSLQQQGEQQAGLCQATWADLLFGIFFLGLRRRSLHLFLKLFTDGELELRIGSFFHPVPPVSLGIGSRMSLARRCILGSLAVAVSSVPPLCHGALQPPPGAVTGQPHSLILLLNTHITGTKCKPPALQHLLQQALPGEGPPARHTW